MSDAKQDETASDSATEDAQKAPEPEPAFEAFKRKVEAAGGTVRTAADAPAENAERARKKYAKRELREKMTRGRLVEPGE